MTTTTTDRMTIARATQIVRDCASQDRALETGGRDDSTLATIDGWHTAGAQAGDLDVCRAIDHLGRDRAARIYDTVNPAE